MVAMLPIALQNIVHVVSNGMPMKIVFNFAATIPDPIIRAGIQNRT
jgi:hypothetical protein